MMKHRKIIKAVIIAAGAMIAAGIPGHVDAKSSKVTYSVKNNVMTVKGTGMMSDNMNFGKKKKTKNIKKLIVKKGVTSISARAFTNCTKLKKVELPSTLNKISALAFFGTGLKSVTIPKSVKYIGENAFSNCKSLKEVTTPAEISVYGLDEYQTATLNTLTLDKLKFTTSIKYLSSLTFSQFDAKNIEVSPSDRKYSSHNGDIYSKDGKTLVYVSDGKTDFTLSKECTKVNLSAFVHYIGEDLTECCNKIKKIDIPATVTKVTRCDDIFSFPNTQFTVDSRNLDMESIRNLIEFLGVEQAANTMPQDVKISGNDIYIRGVKYIKDEAGYIENASEVKPAVETAAAETGLAYDAIYKNPDEINCTYEDPVDSYSYDSKSAGKWVKLNIKEDGVLLVWSNEKIDLYDANKNKLKVFPIVKKGDTLYAKIPDSINDSYKIKGAYIKSLNASTIGLGEENQMMCANGKNQLLNFELKSKNLIEVRIVDYKNNGLGNVSFVMQKRNGTAWENVSTKLKLKSGRDWDKYTHSGGLGSFVRDYYMTLEKGNYRMNITGKKGSLYEVSVSETFDESLAKDKSGKSKKKAVWLLDFDQDIDTGIYVNKEELDSYCVGKYSHSSANTRWYKLKKDKKKSGKLVVELDGASSGKVDVAIYKKGKKKAIRTFKTNPSKILSNAKKSRDNVVLKTNIKKKGIYYIKLQRSKKTTNPAYSCSLRYKIKAKKAG